MSEGGEGGEDFGVNVSYEGEGTEDSRKVVVLEKEVNTPALSGEVIMESVVEEGVESG